LVVSSSADEGAVTRIIALDATMLASYIVCIYEYDHANEEELGRNGSNEQDFCNERPRII
jgi:hypothetical protein